MELQQHQQAFLAHRFEQPDTFRPSEGGHMSYNRLFFDDADGKTRFVKAHDPAFFNEEWREREMKAFLGKEGRYYEHLQAENFAYIPEESMHTDDMLVLNGLMKQEGWHWRAPKDQDDFHRYVTDILQVFDKLESVPALTREPQDEVAIDVFYNHGWDKLHDLDVPAIVDTNLHRWSDILWQRNIDSAHAMAENLDLLFVKRANVGSSVLNHHDARQANIAWHPEHGAKLVDWSWADNGLPNGDATMFLLDLHKSDHDITPYMQKFNPTYGKMVLGYWLQRSATAHTEGNSVVRMQQFVSAIKAAELLLK